MTWLFYLSFGFTLFCAVALAGASALPRKVQRRFLQATRNDVFGLKAQETPARASLLQTFSRIRMRLGSAETPKLRERFLQAGIRSPEALEIYFAVRTLGPIAGLVLGTFIPTNPFLWAMGLAGAAYMAPEFWVDRKVKKRREKIKRSMPDSVDLLVICVDAGLGLDQAMLRAGQELEVSHPEINEEFVQINREQRAGRPRVEAWKNMALRTKLPEVNSFVNMLVQTERFGTPIARALSTFSDDMRLKRKQAAEEKAAKTTVKMLFPLVLFIFPCIFIVLLGPAIIAVSKGLFTMTK